VRALSALGNGGYLVTPHFLTKIIHKDGTEANVAPDDKKQVIKKETSEEITRMLVNVVDVALKRGKVKKEHYSIGAKTGTAQIANVSERGYYSDRYLHSFFGYFPAYDPKYIIFLYHVEPVGARYASQTLTDPFMEIVDFLINYYNVPPDR
jgi:cell division protein FtsI/penicillin-binding protein 2